jgi:hypothetical protein
VYNIWQYITKRRKNQMTETLNKEPVAGEPGAVEPPAQPPSETPAETSAVDVDSMKAILEPMIEDAFTRQAQSVKDKRIAKQESRISSIEDTLAQLKDLKADGMSEKQAIQYLEVKELLASQGQEVPTEVPPTQEPAVQATVAEEAYLSPILKLAGIDANDPEVIAILRDESNPIKQINAVTSLAESRKQANQSPPNQAAALSSGGGQAVETETLESVTAELQAEQAKPRQDITKIRELSKRLKVLLPKQ